MKKKILLRLTFVLLAIITCVSFPVQSEAGRGTAIAKGCTRCTKEVTEEATRNVRETNERMDSVLYQNSNPSTSPLREKVHQEMERKQQESEGYYDNTSTGSNSDYAECVKCDGTGIIFVDNKAELCPICDGSGKIPLK